MVYIRDFLLACLLVMGGGHRSDVIRNMTLEEWNDRTVELGAKDEQVAVLYFFFALFITFFKLILVPTRW